MATTMYEDERRLATERGWYCRFVDDVGYEVCSSSDPDATPDLNRARVALHVERGTIHGFLRCEFS